MSFVKKLISVTGDLKAGVYERLSQDENLKGVITGVFDEVKGHQPFPYIVLGEITANEWSSKTSAGQEVTLTIHTWSEYRGDEEVLDIHRLILESISKSPLDLGSGLGVMLSRLDSEETTKDLNDKLRHGVMILRFRIMEV